MASVVTVQFLQHGGHCSHTLCLSYIKDMLTSLVTSDIYHLAWSEPVLDVIELQIPGNEEANQLANAG